MAWQAAAVAAGAAIMQQMMQERQKRLSEQREREYKTEESKKDRAFREKQAAYAQRERSLGQSMGAERRGAQGQQTAVNSIISAFARALG